MRKERICYSHIKNEARGSEGPVLIIKQKQSHFLVTVQISLSDMLLFLNYVTEATQLLRQTSAMMQLQAESQIYDILF